jgi:hypothetical protein
VPQRISNSKNDVEQIAKHEIGLNIASKREELYALADIVFQAMHLSRAGSFDDIHIRLQRPYQKESSQ